MKNIVCLFLIAITSWASRPNQLNAQVFKNRFSKKEVDSKSTDFEEIVEKAIKFDGLITIYQDSLSGETWMAITDSIINREYIYFSQVEDGVLQTGYFRGAYGKAKVIKFRKNYERIEIIEENTSFYFDPENPLAKAKKANINNPIIASIEIEATSKNDSIYLIKTDELFKKEWLSQIDFNDSEKDESKLGKLNE